MSSGTIEAEDVEMLTRRFYNDISSMRDQQYVGNTFWMLDIHVSDSWSTFIGAKPISYENGWSGSPGSINILIVSPHRKLVNIAFKLRQKIWESYILAP